MLTQDVEKIMMNSKSDTLENQEIFVCAEETVEAPIIDALEHCYQNPSIQLHIPGHTKGHAILPRFKNLVGNKTLFLDATDEHDHVGTLHPAQGLIAKAQNLAAEAFGAAKSYFLVNGSTIGNMALALTVTRPNEKVIIGRNCHRSVTNSMILSGANPIWVQPEKLTEWSIWGAVKPENVEKALIENPDAKTVWITNPTYEGVVSDIESISSICKKYGAMLLVDEAHGSLWRFNDKLPKTAIECGADAAVNSMHKTGGSFAQSSILHVSPNSKVNISELEANLKMLHSTSPSMLLLASIDAARAYISSSAGKQNIEDTINNALMLRQQLDSLPKVRCLSAEDGLMIDPTKIYLMIDGLSGKRLESVLEIEYHIEIESATDNGILALCNIGNAFTDVNYFGECIKSIVKSNLSDIPYLAHLENTKYMPLLDPKTVCTPREAYYSSKEEVLRENLVGRISGELIAECPPGISILVPGELITEAHLSYLMNYRTIKVLKN